jgi:SOS-response transcriptional repressor LexA
VKGDSFATRERGADRNDPQQRTGTCCAVLLQIGRADARSVSGARVEGHSSEWYGTAPVSPLTPAQLRVLQVLRLRSMRGDLPPTYRELQGELGFRSTATIRDHLKALERKGYIRLGGGRFRGVQLLSGTSHDSSQPMFDPAETKAESSRPSIKWFAELLPDGGTAVLWSVSAPCKSGLGLRPGDQVMVDEGAAPSSGDWLAYSLDGKSLSEVLRSGKSGKAPVLSILSDSKSKLRLVGVVRAVIRRSAGQSRADSSTLDRGTSRLVRRGKYAAC